MATWLLCVFVPARADAAEENASPASASAPTNSPPQKGSDWWAFRPLSQPLVPTIPGRTAGDLQPIDAFILAKLAEKKLNPSPEADRRTLIRRLFFDLTGLPPQPAEVEAFLADREPRAYERLVDRLLASPRYGERWARHWLDIVHYGETHGYDKDQPRPNAWPYRDYVIRAFNQDKRYSQFLREQIAGDVLSPDTRDGIEALGFIAAGPWDLIGHAEVPETKIDGKIARHLDRDDMVGNTFQTFNGLTVQCAQCHDHKFDPISQAEYYQLQAVFAALDRADRKYDADPAVGRQRMALAARESELKQRQKDLDLEIQQAAGPALAELDRQIAAGAKSSPQGEAYGYHSAIEKTDAMPKWVQVDLGRVLPLGSIVLHPCHDDYNNIGDGFGFPVRYKVEIDSEEAFPNPILIADRTGSDVPNPKLQAQSFDAGGKSGRFIRVTATKLAPRQDDYIFALAELTALSADGHNVAQGASVMALDSIEAPVRWQRKNLTDGRHPGGRVVDPATLAALRTERTKLLARSTSPAQQLALREVAQELKSTQARLSALPAQSTAYIGTVHTGSGSFIGTGAKGGRPREIRVLQRGNIQKPGDEVTPGSLSCLTTLPARFSLNTNHTEGARRAALADWLASPDNPLTWRTIVNRVWQYHFGRGLVETPNDFGRMGVPPTHPELLDWLALQFRDGGQSFKSLHRLIVTSATYRQQSFGTDRAAAQTDADNRYLWRQNRRKLEAEAVRDAVLLVAGKLDFTMGGPSFKDFVVEKPEHSPHYQYHLADPDDPKTHRRSIYRFIVRSQQQPFMTTLDCADPSMQVGKRNESVSPLQALTMLNNALMIAMARHFAARLEPAGSDPSDAVRRAHYEAVGRPPTPEEATALTAFTREFGLTNLCRVLLNLNEFTFVD
jgi:hypothetical protein